MKKKKIKNLALKRNTISNLSSISVKGGVDSIKGKDIPDNYSKWPTCTGTGLLSLCVCSGPFK